MGKYRRRSRDRAFARGKEGTSERVPENTGVNGAFSGVREKEEEKFESYLQTLFRMGGIDRNVIAGEVLSTEKVGEMIEAGKFQGKEDLEPYLYSLAILLLSQYVKKCLNKLKAMEKGEKR